MSNYVPLYYDDKGSDPAIQWDMYDAEDRGMLKMDFLGLKTLRVIDQSVKWIAYRLMRTFEKADSPREGVVA